MTFPFLNARTKRRDEIVAIDLGGRHTKAVHIQNRNDKFRLISYTIQDSPSDQASCSVDVLAEHLRVVSRALGDSVKNVTVALGVTETVVRQTEMPAMPVGDIRQLLKFNSKNYLQQDLPDHVFDCSFILPRAVNGGAEASKPAASQKQKLLVGAAKRQIVEDIETAVKQAGLVPAQVVPGLVGPVNAFERSQAEAFGQQAVALVDIGFRNSTISLLECGELIMHRVVNIAGDRLTSGLAESLSISYAEAEGIKVGMATEVQQNLDPLVMALGRELRAFIDFFEHQQDAAVSHVFVSGGSARNELIVQALQTEILIPCQSWNPAKSLESTLSPQQQAQFDNVAPQFAVAVGTALSGF